MKIIAVWLACLPLFIQAQQVDSTINNEMDGTNVHFSINLPALKPIPGGPAPFYTYFWDFGDGHFSTEEMPLHIYDSIGNFDCRFYAVNNYDDGRKPGKRHKKIVVQRMSKENIAANSPAENNFFKANGSFELKYNCMAKPGDTMLLTIGYKNDVAITQKGKLYLFVNEKAFNVNCFDTLGNRFFHAEKPLAKNDLAILSGVQKLTLTQSGSPASHIKKSFNKIESQQLLAQTLQTYKNIQGFAIDSMKAGQQQFIFSELAVTPQMIEDTNATLVITGLFVPDDGVAIMHKLNIPVVTSHDPNKMSLTQGRLSYRFLKKKKAIGYKIRFQNNGEGPARKVLLDITLPSVFAPESFVVKDVSPYCPSCDSVPDKKGCWELINKKDSLQFIFHQIYLPGTSQKGITDKDSTKGFVEFSVTTKKRMDKLPFKGRTAIYFDKNEPVFTNMATGRFKKGFSPILMAGYQYQFNNGFDKGLQFGVGLAPLAPYKPYFQVEAFYQSSTGSIGSRTVERQGTIIIDSLKYDYTSVFTDTTRTIQHLKFVPIHLRHNLNKFISVGIGLLADFQLSNKTTVENTFRLGFYNGVQNYPYKKTSTISASNTYVQPFADIQLGLVRLGPMVGFRYYYGGSQTNYAYFYAAWRL